MIAPAPLPRRAFLRHLSSLAAASLALPALRAQSVIEDPAFRFIVVNDLHHQTEACDPFFRQLVTQMSQHRDVALCLVVGDLADKGRPESLTAIRDIFAHLGVPIYPVPGNHDCDVEHDTRLYSEVFPDRLNYRFEHGGWQFVGFDSTDGNDWGGTTVQPNTLSWLDRNLPRLDPERPTIAFTHFPMSSAARADLTPLNAPDVVARFNHLNLRTMFTGHFHARTEARHNSATLLTNACCARVRDNHDDSLPEGYLLCTAQADGTLEREFVEYAPAIDSVSDKTV